MFGKETEKENLTNELEKKAFGDISGSCIDLPLGHFICFLGVHYRLLCGCGLGNSGHLSRAAVSP